MNFHAFSLKFSVAGARSGRDLVNPVKKKENLVDFLQNFHLRKSRFFKSFSLRKTIGSGWWFVLGHMSSWKKNQISFENRRRNWIRISLSRAAPRRFLWHYSSSSSSSSFSFGESRKTGGLWEREICK